MKLLGSFLLAVMILSLAGGLPAAKADRGGEPPLDLRRETSGACALVDPAPERPASDSRPGAWGPSAVAPDVTVKNLEVLARVGGRIDRVARSGARLYVSLSGNLKVFDVSDPRSPRALGSPIVPGAFVGVSTNPNTVYVLSASKMLQLVDLGNLDAPKVLGAYQFDQGRGVQVFEAGGYAYAGIDADWGGKAPYLAILNIADPAHPTPISRYDLPGNPTAIKVVAGRAYVATAGGQTSGLTILDVANPAAPSKQAFYPGPAELWTIDVSGARLYLGWGDSNWNARLEIVDVTKPGEPRSVGQLSFANTRLFDLNLLGGYVVAAAGGPYLAPEFVSGLFVIDVKDPAKPRKVAFSAVPLAAVSEAVAGDVVYVANSTIVGYGGDFGALGAREWNDVRAFDLTSPSSPVQSPLAGLSFPRISVPRAVAQDGNLLFVSDQDTGLNILDVADPRRPELLSAVDYSYLFDSFALRGSFVYTLDRRLLRILDVSNPRAPVDAGSLALEDVAQQVLVRGNYAYLAGSYLSVVDIRDPRHPVPAGPPVKQNDGWATGLALQDDVLFVSFAQGLGPSVNEVVAISVSDPAHPKRAGSLGFDLRPEALAVDRGRVYVALNDWYYTLGRLAVLDVSDAARIREVGGYGGPGTMSLAAGAHRIYAAGNVTEVLDTSVPELPASIALYPAASRDIAAGADLIYVAGYNTVDILQYTGAELDGRVLDWVGQPFGTVELIASGPESRSTSTGNDGSYHLGGLLRGDYQVVPTLEGYAFWPKQRLVSLDGGTNVADFTILAGPQSVDLLPGVRGWLAYVDTEGLHTELAFGLAAVGTPTRVVVTPTVAAPGAGLAFTGHAFALDAFTRSGGAPVPSFNEPVALTIAYSDRDVRSVSDERSLRVYRWNDFAWEDAAAGCPDHQELELDPDLNVIRTAVCKPGMYVLFGARRQVFVPMLTR